MRGQFLPGAHRAVTAAVVLAVACLVWSPALARGRKPSRARAPQAKPVTPAQPTPAPATPAATVKVPVTEAKPAPVDFASVAEQLAAAESAVDGLEFDRALELAKAALAREDINEEERVRAYLVVGAAYAVMGNVLDAERPYRLLLRLRPDFQLPANTPPKIMGVFRKVQGEENAIKQAVAEAQRRAIVADLRMDTTVPSRHKGGTPLAFLTQLTDPHNGVASVVLQYRYQGQDAFSTVPFQARGDALVAEFTAAQTATDKPKRMEYVVLARATDGAVLAQRGSESQPEVVEIDAGQVVGPPIWEQGQFRALAGGGAAAVALGSVVAVSTAVLAAAVGGTLLYLVARGDGVPQTTAGRHRI